MYIKTSKEMYDSLKEKGATPERILEVMMGRADRHLNSYESLKERFNKLHAEHRELQQKTGRLVNVKVDHIAQDSWGTYTWYKHNMYRYAGDGVWKKYNPKDRQAPHYQAEHMHGIYMVNILLAEEDMPEMFIGKCTGNVLGQKVIMAQGHMIGYNDEFELRKINNA